MQSIRELYPIGHGPSSSHTMGLRRAVELFRRRYPNPVRYRITLFGSLAATGKMQVYSVSTDLYPPHG
jgi:L-serine dehydratase